MFNTEPRENHYIFAHHVLPQLIRENPYSWFSNFAEKGPELLKEVWEQVTKKCESKNVVAWNEEQVTIHTLSLLDYPVAVIVLPKVEAPTEAFAVAAVLMSTEKEQIEKPKVRYFTYERFVDVLRNETKAAFCEWTGGVHNLIEHGLEINPNVFVEKIKRQLAG